MQQGNSAQKYESEIDSENNIVLSNQQTQFSLGSINLKMHSSISQQSQDQKQKSKSKAKQSKHNQELESPMSPPKSNAPNPIQLNRLQLLNKKINNWSEEIDVNQYKPHQIHEMIDNLKGSDESIDNKEVVNILKCILSKHPGKRNTKEIQFVRKALKDVKFFSEIQGQLPEDLILRLCKFLTYERYPQLHTLYRAGDFGRKFYITLEGAVFILTPSIEKTFDTNISENKEVRKIKQMIMHQFEATPKHNAAANFEEALSDEEIIQQVVIEQNEGYNIKKTLEKGEGFGEIALRTEGIRTASVVCKEDSHFVSIASTTYNEIIDAYHDKLYKEKIDFLKNISIFKKWGLAYVHEIMMQITIKEYKRGDILYEEGQKSKDLYFVRSGEVEVNNQIMF